MAQSRKGGDGRGEAPITCKSKFPRSVVPPSPAWSSPFPHLWRACGAATDPALCCGLRCCGVNGDAVKGLRRASAASPVCRQTWDYTSYEVVPHTLIAPQCRLPTLSLAPCGGGDASVPRARLRHTCQMSNGPACRSATNVSPTLPPHDSNMQQPRARSQKDCGCPGQYAAFMCESKTYFLLTGLGSWLCQVPAQRGYATLARQFPEGRGTWGYGLDPSVLVRKRRGTYERRNLSQFVLTEASLLPFFPVERNSTVTQGPVCVCSSVVSVPSYVQYSKLDFFLFFLLGLLSRFPRVA